MPKSRIFTRSSGVMRCSGFQVAVDDSLSMETGERVADLARDVERCAGREPSLVTEDRAKRRSLDVLHDEIRPALLASLQHAHDVGVQHRAPDLLLALESRKRYHVDLVLQVWDLQRNGSARPRIDCLEDRRRISPRAPFATCIERPQSSLAICSQMAHTKARSYSAGEPNRFRSARLTSRTFATFSPKRPSIGAHALS